MTEAMLIWLYLSVGELLESFMVIGILYGIFLGIGAVDAAMIADMNMGDKPSQKASDFLKKAKAKLYAVLFTALIIVFSFYPSKEDLKFIIGGAAVWNTAEYLQNSEEAKKLPDNILKSMNNFLEQVNEKPEK